ncbi:MAG: phytanoyl-CoA dioxygenase family protein [Lentisphaeria bacterium]
MSSHDLTPEQLEFFDTFGFLALPGALAGSIAEITAAFDEIWATRGDGHNGKAHDPAQRSCIVPFIDQHERLCALLEEPCIHGLLCSLLGNNFNYMGSDGNYYAGDTVWHSDGWHPVLRYVKIALYLDPLRRDTGCLRVIPGSHKTGDTYSEKLEQIIRRKKPLLWGVEGKDLPAIALETDPGDVLVFNHNLKHAAFGGDPRRRMFTINCSQRFPDDQISELKDYIAHSARFWLDRVYGETMMATANAQRLVHLEQAMANDGHLPALAAKAREEMTEPARG